MHNYYNYYYYTLFTYGSPELNS